MSKPPAPKRNCSTPPILLSPSVFVHGEMPFKHGTIAEVAVKRQTGVIDEDIEPFDFLDSCLNLRGIGHVQGQGRDAPIRFVQRLARTDIHPPAPLLKALALARCRDWHRSPELLCLRLSYACSRVSCVPERRIGLLHLGRSGPGKRVTAAPRSTLPQAAAPPNASTFLSANSKNVAGWTLNSWWVERSTCDSSPPFSRSSTCLSRASANSGGIP
jgi:hypothetical protein